MSGTTLTVHVSGELRKKLAILAKRTGRSNSVLAAEAIADYVARETAIGARIERGLEDMRAGRVVPHDEVMAEVDSVIDRAKGQN